MIPWIAGRLGTGNIQVWLIVAGLAVAAVGGAIGYIYHKGERAGADKVDAAVERTTNTEVEKARKEQRDAEKKVRESSPDAVIDSTR